MYAGQWRHRGEVCYCDIQRYTSAHGPRVTQSSSRVFDLTANGLVDLECLLRHHMSQIVIAAVMYVIKFGKPRPSECHVATGHRQSRRSEVRFYSATDDLQQSRSRYDIPTSLQVVLTIYAADKSLTTIANAADGRWPALSLCIYLARPLITDKRCHRITARLGGSGGPMDPNLKI